MAKEPRPGKVKTRMRPPLTSRQAAELYRCFLLDRLEEMRDLGRHTDGAIAYTPASAGEDFSRLGGGRYRTFPQSGGGLGGKLASLFDRAFGEGYETVSVVDSDSPDLPRKVVLSSFRLLGQGSDVTFGPCRDGGYYLVGLRRPSPALFRNIPWSTPSVLARSLETAEALGLKVSLLPRWRDLDRFEDLLAFYQQRRQASGGEAAAAARTMAHLKALLAHPPRCGRGANR